MAINVELYYEKYAPMVFRRCRQLLKNEEETLDAVQDVFVKLIRNQQRLRGDYPSSLLYTMATNTCLNRLRWRKHHSESSNDDVSDMLLLSTDTGYDEVDAKLIIDSILSTESEKTRVICYLYFGDNMTLAEIGAMIGLSVSGVRKHLISFQSRARIKLNRGVEV